MLALALLVNPVVRGFLGRVICRRTHEEHYRKQQATLVVRKNGHAVSFTVFTVGPLISRIRVLCAAELAV